LTRCASIADSAQLDNIGNYCFASNITRSQSAETAITFVSVINMLLITRATLC